MFEVPGGRSVTVMINATSNHSEGGQLESVALTLQEMTPLQRLERMHADSSAW